jgi:hypothetical protein
MSPSLPSSPRSRYLALLLASLSWSCGERTALSPDAPTAEAILGPNTVTLTGAPATLPVAATATVTAAVTNPAGMPVSGRIRWTSSAPEVATVVDGLVTAVAPGTTRIRATLGTSWADFELVVRSLPEEWLDFAVSLSAPGVDRAVDPPTLGLSLHNISYAH